ncbi:MAG: LruC domain-containing protein [Bacteroidaceae bacterium]|nr:LruC domain-containing protein [Bacteroidaceae bacterium]MBP9636918.1 LruC domain-containing protein [Bacteroidaceae bacterium]
MKKCFSSIIALLVLLLFSGCVNNPEWFETPAASTTNPLSEITVKTGFDWSTTRQLSVTINVNDEQYGYPYTVAVYDANPIGNVSANEYTVGTAQKDMPYTVKLTIPIALKTLFVKQTDPKGRVLVGEFAIDQTSNDLVCSFLPTAANGSSAKSSKKLSSRLIDANGNTVPSFTAIPTGALELATVVARDQTNNADVLQDNTDYKITSNYEGLFRHNGTKGTRIFVNAVWKIPAGTRFQKGLEIIVLPGASLVTSGSTTLIGTTQLDVMSGAKATFGTLSLSNNNQIYNLGTFAADALSDNPGLFYNANGATATITSFGANAGSGKYTIENRGVINCDNFSVNSGQKLYNYCTIATKNNFSFQGGTITMDQGMVTSKTMTFNGTTVYLYNGSMLSASESINMQSNDNFDGGTGTVTSLIKAPTYSISSGVTFKGNLVAESNYYPGNQWWKPYSVQAPAFLTSYGGSTVVIELCSSSEQGNGGNSGNTPTGPTYPLVIKDSTQYNYAFEDLWPSYGDYDLNDIVIAITSRTLNKEEDGSISSAVFTGKLSAVGAGTRHAAAMQLKGITSSDIQGAVTLSEMGTIGFNNENYAFDLSSQNIENNQDDAVVIPICSDAHRFIRKDDQLSYVNTSLIDPLTPERKFTIKLNFVAGAVTEEDLATSLLDLFIITKESELGRKEVHLSTFGPTKLINKTFLGAGNCAGSDNPYLTKEGFCFGLLIPGAYYWPQEKAKINEVYSDFSEWATSGGVSKTDWFLPEKANADLVFPVGSLK